MHNNISHIENEVFIKDKEIYSNELNVLNLSYNTISKLQNGSMLGLQSVKQLMLNNNRITNIENGVFSPLLNMVVLALQHNPLFMLIRSNFISNSIILAPRYVTLSQETTLDETLFNATDIVIWRV